MRIGAAALIALCSTLVTGCAHIKRTYLADGQPGYFVRCGTWSNCLVKAGRLCGTRGFTPTYTDELDREMLLACKSPPP
jgi:hypothetical protein